ncbi:MAG: hypothetical protein PHS07_03700 [Patescibacteria group bacterium]|nr:hypothetical protein [Patescibacteria group bacterium]
MKKYIASYKGIVNGEEMTVEISIDAPNIRQACIEAEENLATINGLMSPKNGPSSSFTLVNVWEENQSERIFIQSLDDALNNILSGG